MTQWEYLNINIGGNSIAKSLNNYGEQGWELIEAKHYRDSQGENIMYACGEPGSYAVEHWKCIFKRIKQPHPDTNGS